MSRSETSSDYFGAFQAEGHAERSFQGAARVPALGDSQRPGMRVPSSDNESLCIMSLDREESLCFIFQIFQKFFMAIFWTQYNLKNSENLRIFVAPPKVVCTHLQSTCTQPTEPVVRQRSASCHYSFALSRISYTLNHAVHTFQ